MAKPVTDSRFPGFNPEVEASKAAAAEAEKKAAAAADPARAAVEALPPPTHRCTVCGGLFGAATTPCPHCGAEYELQKV
jgi:rubrerythrin